MNRWPVRSAVKVDPFTRFHPLKDEFDEDLHSTANSLTFTAVKSWIQRRRSERPSEETQRPLTADTAEHNITAFIRSFIMWGFINVIRQRSHPEHDLHWLWADASVSDRLCYTLSRWCHTPLTSQTQTPSDQTYRRFAARRDEWRAHKTLHILESSLRRLTDPKPFRIKTCFTQMILHGVRIRTMNQRNANKLWPSREFPADGILSFCPKPDNNWPEELLSALQTTISESHLFIHIPITLYKHNFWKF